MHDYNKYTTSIDFSGLKALLEQEGNLKYYTKGDIFTPLNGRCNYVGYILSGAFRYACFNSDGSERVVGYGFESGYVGNYITFQHKILSNVEIRAVCDSSVYVITYNKLNDFYNANMENQHWGRRLAEILLLEVYDRLLSMYSMSPKERYLEILNRCPGLLNIIPLKELASYLMISPETLSRIRKELVSG